ncbi:hypothetical protein ES708_28515 [subsurface metagenome]
MKSTMKTRIDNTMTAIRARARKIEMDLDRKIHNLETQIRHEREVADASLAELTQQAEALNFITPQRSRGKAKPAPEKGTPR